MQRLRCAYQNYDWGNIGPVSSVYQLLVNSQSIIEFNSNQPYAELWMGTHSQGPSLLWSHKKKDLSNYIFENNYVLGKSSLTRFGTQLPFLFKVLSVRKALSIQAHPDKTLAKKLHADRPDLYKDSNHKPELAIALTDFEALLGFRPVAEILAFCNQIPELKNLLQVTSNTSTESPPVLIQNLFSALMNTAPSTVSTVATTLADRFAIESTPLDIPELTHIDLNDLVQLFLRLHYEYPGDVGCFSIFFLNYLKLIPGEAIFLAANLPHAYLSGDCIECMANSDNVVRAGLTPKFKDVSCLLNMLNFEPIVPDKIRFAPKVSTIEGITISSFTPPVEDFAVNQISIPEISSAIVLPTYNSASILLFMKGHGTITSTIEDQDDKAKGICNYVTNASLHILMKDLGNVSSSTDDYNTTEDENVFDRGHIYFVPARCRVTITTTDSVEAFCAYANVQ